jgi:hypothetical protein
LIAHFSNGETDTVHFEALAFATIASCVFIIFGGYGRGLLYFFAGSCGIGLVFCVFIEFFWCVRREIDRFEGGEGWMC